MGYVNDRLDVSLLEAVSDAGVSLLLVGPKGFGYRGDGFDALVRRPTVRWVGPQPYEELPRYLRLMDVGLTPYADTPFNRASFPLKTLEYLAAGRRTVATRLPATDWLDTDLVAVADTPEAFARCVREAVATRPSPDEVDRRRAFARQHSWASRAAALARLIDGETGDDSR
jgi:teichuronic acid biosynthesis glycosyltransferase TuaH